MDWMSPDMDARPQAGIKPCGYLPCSTSPLRHGRSGAGTRASGNSCSATASCNSNFQSTPATLSRRRLLPPAAGESPSESQKEDGFGCFTSPNASLPVCPFCLEIAHTFRKSRLSSFSFFNRRVAASLSHGGTYGRCSVSERRLAAVHSLKRSPAEPQGSVSERRLAAVHSRAPRARRQASVYPSDGWPQSTAHRPACVWRL